jgi:quercetin dioxygenase-like cupin family protein
MPDPAHHVATVDWAFAAQPAPPTPTIRGLSRQLIVGPAHGAVHTDLAVGALQPGGRLARHLHSYEEVLYLLAGELIVELEGRVHRLRPGDYTLHPIGAWHGLANASSEDARWLSVNTPQRLDAESARKDTYFAPASRTVEELDAMAERPPFGDPSLRWVGHYRGTPPQAEALALDDPAHGRRSAGRDTALTVYSGISVKMLADRVFGAELLTVFTVDYEPGGAAQAHDHPFEEAYFFLEGEIEAELDGTTHTIRAGDVVFAGVGSVHGFYNTGSGRVRWIETQAPQPPARHSYRWVDDWRRFGESVG